MADDRQIVHSGGCQCGAVRYAFYAEPYGTHLCHCRMCQKAFGSAFAPLTLIRYKDFAWTRGEPAIFRSSPKVARGFCAACGTPLSFAHDDCDYIDISLGSLDHPEQVKPETQICVDSRIPWLAELGAIEERRTEEVLVGERFADIQNFQHPDHDTETWPPAR